MEGRASRGELRRGGERASTGRFGGVRELRRGGSKGRESFDGGYEGERELRRGASGGRESLDREVRRGERASTGSFEDDH